MKHQPPRFWTPERDAALREAYARGGICAARDAFPGLTDSSLYHRANRLGIERRRRWTRSERARLVEMWGAFTIERIAKAVGHPVVCTYYEAHRIGLRRGVPQGMESLTAAARRAGFSIDSLRRVLRWAGVHTRAAMSKPGGLYRHRCVDPDAVDRAVARWAQAETVQAAARRYGTSGGHVRDVLISAGHEPPAKHRAHWRLDARVIDAAMSARHALETVRRGALRHGLVPHTLSLWLQRAGVISAPKSGGGYVRLAPAVIDRVVGENRARANCRARRAA